MMEVTKLEWEPIGAIIVFGDPWNNSVWIKTAMDMWRTHGEWDIPLAYTSKQLANLVNNDPANNDLWAIS